MTYLDCVGMKQNPKHQGVNFSDLITVSPIETINRPRYRSNHIGSNSIRRSNLINVKIDKHDHLCSNDFLKVASMNCRSLKNKFGTVLSYITEQDLSLRFLTEAWLKPEYDDFILKSTVPNDFKWINKP